MRAEELQTVREQCAYSSAESGLYRTILHKGGYIIGSIRGVCILRRWHNHFHRQK